MEFNLLAGRGHRYACHKTNQGRGKLFLKILHRNPQPFHSLLRQSLIMLKEWIGFFLEVFYVLVYTEEGAWKNMNISIQGASAGRYPGTINVLQDPDHGMGRKKAAVRGKRLDFIQCFPVRRFGFTNALCANG